MADYREISQTYAQGAIKVAVLLNSGAILAVLAQAQHLAPLLGGAAYFVSSVLWVCGATSGAAAWAIGFYSTRFVDRAERGDRSAMAISNRLMHKAALAVAASLILFVAGSLWFAFNFLSVPATTL